MYFTSIISTFESMKKIAEILPTHVRVLLARLGITALMLYLTRLLFLFYNAGSFPRISVADYFIALWFDFITIGLFFLPYYLLFLLPFKFHHLRAHRIFFKVLFHVTNALMLALNILDVEYFRYTSKRSTYDLFSTVSTGNDMSQLWTSFLKDFWFLLLIFIVLIGVSEYLYRRTEKMLRAAVQEPSLRMNTIAFLVFAPIFFIIGRGGFGLKPTSIIDASLYSLPENTAFILNTPFTMVKTIDQTGLEPVHFFSDAECDKIFDPIQQSVPQNILPDSTNVVVILLESFGVEFVGAYQNGRGYTPFLDSLIEQSLYFENGFANGKKSIEAVPAIIASLPSLMDAPYIYSPYATNTLQGLPSILKKYGYSSGFYHGATNGSMGFDGFASLAGYDKYVGRKEYNNEKHADKTWGILDEYFNPWTARQLSNLKQPFFGTLFTLSSHHPYFIPEHMRSRVKNGPQKICASISYGDIALKAFFEEAKKQDWYENTIFVIVADHSPSTNTELYNQRTHMYKIPVVFYHPGGLIKPQKNSRIFQQLDILPTLLDLLNIRTSYYSYGSSFYQQDNGEALTYLSGTYYYFRDDFMLTFTGDQARNLYNFKTDQMPQIDSLSHEQKVVKKNERRLKALIQRYNRDLITNQTRTYEKENSLHH